MTRIFRWLSALAIAGLVLPVCGDAWDDAIRENPDRAAGLFHSYEFADIRDTPPPDGFAPVYVSHYGRHGSRRQTPGYGAPAYEALAAAEKAGLLTAVGADLLKDVRRIHAAHEGMEGELTERGGREHRELARRLYARVPAVFAGARTVRCQSSTFPRCLVSMANFTTALKDAAPGLDVTFATGEKIRETLALTYSKNKARRDAIKAYRRKALEESIDPDPLLKRLFTDTAAARALMKDSREFAVHLFLYACSCQCLKYELDGLDISRVFTADERRALSHYADRRVYSSMGNSAEFGALAVWSARRLAADILTRADAALADGGVAADLRFAHDCGLWPLTGLLGLGEAGVRAPVADASTACPTWKNMSMASNLQIIFYRNPAGDVLVKFLFNERETLLTGGPAPSAGPYYRWPDARAFLAAAAAPAPEPAFP